MINKLSIEKYLLPLVTTVFTFFIFINSAHAELIRYDFESTVVSVSHFASPNTTGSGYVVIDDDLISTQHFGGDITGVVDFKWNGFGSFTLDDLTDFYCVCNNTSAASKLTFSTRLNASTARRHLQSVDSMEVISGAGEAAIVFKNKVTWKRSLTPSIPTTAINKLLANDSFQTQHFGISVAVSGDTAVIGADVSGSHIDTGSAYIFSIGNNGSWLQQAKLLPNDPSKGNNFGHSVAIFGNTAVVGASSDSYEGTRAGGGSSYIFVRNNSGNWVQQEKLRPDNGRAQQLFGQSVSIFEDTAVIGARGSAYVFIRDSNGSWVQQQELVRNDVSPNFRGTFGYSVSISENTVVVGSRRINTSDSDFTVPYVFVRDNDGNWTQQDKLFPDNIGLNDSNFGNSLSISGDTVIIGDQLDDDNGENSGSAYIFSRDSNGSWSQKAKLLANDGNIQDRFSVSVSISEDKAVIGSYLDDTNGYRSRASYIFIVSPWVG